ncbi:Endopolyphosphatase [Mortierella polycephala]|uniref:Endopolyphosphatase n=1 Tax=Mortierella polycephala TaxID=41804 RepID=A0A9P6PVX5_9FUNG|nr:Endopolyphosphatase [Mortierella polycephala]
MRLGRSNPRHASWRSAEVIPRSVPYAKSDGNAWHSLKQDHRQTSRCSTATSAQMRKTCLSSSRTRWIHSTPSHLLFVCCILHCLWHLPIYGVAQPDRSYEPKESSLFGNFLHITDIHPDEFYIAGGTISSSCHKNTTSDDEDGLVGPGRTDGGVGGKYGAPYSICDSPFSLTNATFDWIDRNLIGNIDFVVWTGDNARHDSDNKHPRTQKEIEDLNQAIAEKFLEIFKHDEDDPFQTRIPIVPSIGNNDVYPHNIMEPGPNRILQHLSDIWSEFIPEDQYHTFQHGGYYTSEVVTGKISVIALNTLYFFNQNAAVDGCDSNSEPGTEQMDWLEVELKSMRRRKMVAYLTGHVPPARKSYSTSCFIRYTDIALRYQDVIVGHLFGHANIDHFFLLSESTVTGTSSDADEIEESEMGAEAGRIRGSTQKNFRTTGMTRSRQQDEDINDNEYDLFHGLGLNSYLLELWRQYEGIPKHVKLNDYAVVLVSPSVIPTYNPTLRVYSYQLTIEKEDGPLTLNSAVGKSEEEEEDDEEEEKEYLDESDENDFVKKKKKKKPKKPKRPANPPAVPPITFGFPLNYTQYWVNLTHTNLLETQPEFEIEYRTQEDYGLQDLSVAHWLDLAKKIVKDEQLKKEYLAWMVVLTGTENDHLQ